MTKSVKAGSILDMFKSIDEFFKWLNEDAGMKVSNKKLITDEEDEDVNIGERYTVNTDEGKINVKVLAVKPPFKRSGKVDLYMISDRNDKKNIKNIEYKEVPGEIEAFLIDCFGDDIFEEVEEEEEEVKDGEEELEKDTEESDNTDTDTEESESKDISGSTKIQIECSRDINTSDMILSSTSFTCDPIFANEIICEVMESDEFINGLPDTDTVYYEIIPTNTEIEITEIQDTEYIEPSAEQWMFDIYKSQYITRLRLELQRIEVGYEAGVDSSLLYTIQNQMYVILDLISKTSNNIYTIQDIIKHLKYDEIYDISNMTYRDILEIYAQCLDVHYPNLPHEIQSLVDNWLLSIRY